MHILFQFSSVSSTAHLASSADDVSKDDVEVQNSEVKIVTPKPASAPKPSVDAQQDEQDELLAKV
jgi:hypothetical protein